MSLKVRMGLAAGIAVAIAVIAVAVSAYAGTRDTLRAQLDSSLRALTEPLVRQSRHAPLRQVRPARAVSGPAGNGSTAVAGSHSSSSGGILGLVLSGDCDAGLGIDERPAPAFGGARGYVQLVRTDGAVCLANDEHVPVDVDPPVGALARRGTGQLFMDEDVGDTQMRVLVTGLPRRGALMVGLSLAQVNQALHSELLLLIVIAAAGIALAALLGLLVSRTALAPIARFTRQTEEIARRPDRIESERLRARSGDELSRLADAFNATLDALAASVEAQRNLVADASHELRTPVASIRANLQLMRDERLLSEADREALRADVIAELDQLTALVGDVVELARGAKLESEPGELRLDSVIEEAVMRARRRAPALPFETALEATVIRGDGDRVARAVSNLLDNASKWSPEGETVEVSLRDGVLAVRDHGPGFDEEDLPFVFDRFHRAKRARSKPGSGLGLAIVRQAAEAHGGYAEAMNAPGGGALLRVSFGHPLELTERHPPIPVAADARPLRSNGASDGVHEHAAPRKRGS